MSDNIKRKISVVLHPNNCGVEDRNVDLLPETRPQKASDIDSEDTIANQALLSDGNGSAAWGPLPSNVSDLTNDANYVTKSDVVYIVDYASPDFAAITNAFNAGKVVLLKGASPDANSYATLNYVSNSYVTFTKFLASRHGTHAALNTYYLDQQNSWSTTAQAQNLMINKVTANEQLVGNESELTSLKVGSTTYSIPSTNISDVVYIVDYENPNYTDILAAYNAGKVVLLKGANPDPTSYAILNYVTNTYATFSKFLVSRKGAYAAFNTYYLNTSNSWNETSSARNMTLNRVTANEALTNEEDSLSSIRVGTAVYSVMNPTVVNEIPLEGEVNDKLYLIENDAPAEILDTLKGTTWQFNNSLNLAGTIIENQEYKLNFTDAAGNKYTRLSKRGSARLKYTGNQPDVYNNGWASEDYQTITITGGEDIDTLELVEFIQLNATLMAQDVIQSYDAYLYHNGWKKITPDITTKQDTLVSGTNIKTINNNSILGEGNLQLKNYQVFNPNWKTNGTTKKFCDDINADPDAVLGMEYLGGVTFTDFPVSGLHNADVIVDIIAITGGKKVIKLTMTSGSVEPYHWEYTYWNNGNSISGWKAWQPLLKSGDNIRSINHLSLLGSGNMNIGYGIEKVKHFRDSYGNGYRLKLADGSYKYVYLPQENTETIDVTGGEISVGKVTVAITSLLAQSDITLSVCPETFEDSDFDTSVYDEYIQDGIVYDIYCDGIPSGDIVTIKTNIGTGKNDVYTYLDNTSIQNTYDTSTGIVEIQTSSFGELAVLYERS